MTEKNWDAPSPFKVDWSTDSNLKYRSGLEMLAEMPSRPPTSIPKAIKEFLARVGANDLTWRRWAGVNQFQAWEGVALHHRLDPSAMRSLCKKDSKETMLEVLFREYSHVFSEKWGDPLYDVGVHFVSVDRAISRGTLKCIKASARTQDCVVSVEDFRRLFGHVPVLVDRLLAALMANSDVAQVEVSTMRPRQYTKALDDAIDFSRSVSEGGSYVPGVIATYPDVDSYLKTAHGYLSQSIRQAICTIVRPTDLPKGRPPKAC